MLYNHTNITLDTLLEFNRNHLKFKKWFFVFYIICTVICFASLGIYLYSYHLLDSTDFNWRIVYICAAVLLFDIYYILLHTVLLKKNLKKSPLIGAQITYEFTENALTSNAVSENLSEHTTIKYDLIHHVTESDRFLYIYVQRNAAHIIDKNGFTEGDADVLKTLLKSKLPPKKIKF